MKDTTSVKYKAKKSFKGFVSVRSYIVDKAIAKKQDLIIEFDGKIMTVPNDYLRTAGQLHKKKFKSKFDNKEYELYDFFFLADSDKGTVKVLF